MIATLAMAPGLPATAEGAGVPLLKTPAWGRPGVLQLRLDAASPGALFMRRAEGAVYRYDPQAGQLAHIDVASWEQGGAAVADCDRQYPAKSLRLDAATGTLFGSSGRIVRVGGRSAATTRQAPSGRYAAVLSDGGTRASVMPFAGQGRKGPFHHDVVTLPEGTPVGATVRLPFGSGVTAVVHCWSPDDAYVVYADALLTGVAVVPVNPSGKKP